MQKPTADHEDDNTAVAWESNGEAIESIRVAAGKDSKIVFISGSFNILHSGHIRLLLFGAECGDFLVVGLTKDGEPGVTVPQDLRLEALKSISAVDSVFVFDGTLESVIKQLKPDVVVKGAEHKSAVNIEGTIVDAYGGELLFGNSDSRFSLAEMMRSELNEINYSAIQKNEVYENRHKFKANDLVPVVNTFAGLNVVVIGDLIVDEYVHCEPLGMSQEDPTLVVSPYNSELFLGGAGIVAAHARGLGANTHFISICGNDETASLSRQKLLEYDVEHVLIEDSTRPTTLKKRFRAQNKTLLRVNELRQHDIDDKHVRMMKESLVPVLDKADLLIFSDFNYGCLPQVLVDDVIDMCRQRGIIMAADSQSSSQHGDVSRFYDMTLVTPTEREIRLALRDFSAGLVILADGLQKKSNAKNVIITLGSEGVFIQPSPQTDKAELITDRLYSMNVAPKDVAGAGDSMLAATAMALATGAPIWQAAYLGSLAAACQVGRVGNIPLKFEDLIAELNH